MPGIQPSATCCQWRLIVDLSHPARHSVNNGIKLELCSLLYSSPDDAAAIITKLDRGTMFTKLDLENTYQIVPVNPDDRWLLGMEWEGGWYNHPDNICKRTPPSPSHEPVILFGPSMVGDFLSKQNGVSIMSVPMRASPA